MQTILLIEDDHDTRVALRQNLEAEGYFVFTAANGRDGIAALRRLDPLPGLIILDMIMPLMSGQEFLDAISSLPGSSGVPVLVISAHETDLPKGASVLLKKPFDLARLLGEVRRLLGGIGGNDPQ
ncbi:MAG TPA: response regulator [Bdellovibrionota bacterium]|nr:response regulator [Bdellovibrionota bacterium]